MSNRTCTPTNWNGTSTLLSLDLEPIMIAAPSPLPPAPSSSASGSTLKRVTSWGALKNAFSRGGNTSFSSSGKLVIQVQYCSGCGYDKQYEDLKAYLERKMGDRIEVVAKKDKKITGNFEVSVPKTGDLLHSKKVAGQGRAESREERRAILQQIELLLDGSEE